MVPPSPTVDHISGAQCTVKYLFQNIFPSNLFLFAIQTRPSPTFAEDPHSPLQRFAVFVVLLDAEAEPPPTLRLLLLSKEAACERSGLEELAAPPEEAVEAAWMLSAERLFCGLDDPRPGKELPRTEEDGAMMGAISSELEAELISLDLPPPPRPDCKTALDHDHEVR